MLAVKDSHETAATQFVQVGANRLTYRRFGRPSEFPLLLLTTSLQPWTIGIQG